MSKPNTLKIDDVEYVRKDSSPTQELGDEVIVRTFSAGVHIGNLISENGTRVELANARRLWKWNGAFTLNEVASLGINRKESRICKIVPKIILTEAIEIIPIIKGVNLSPTE